MVQARGGRRGGKAVGGIVPILSVDTPAKITPERRIYNSTLQITHAKNTILDAFLAIELPLSAS